MSFENKNEFKGGNIMAKYLLHLYEININTKKSLQLC